MSCSGGELSATFISVCRSSHAYEDLSLIFSPPGALLAGRTEFIPRAAATGDSPPLLRRVSRPFLPAQGRHVGRRRFARRLPKVALPSRVAVWISGSKYQLSTRLCHSNPLEMSGLGASSGNFGRLNCLRRNPEREILGMFCRRPAKGL